jgi:hypothetical protein
MNAGIGCVRSCKQVSWTSEVVLIGNRGGQETLTDRDRREVDIEVGEFTKRIGL